MPRIKKEEMQKQREEIKNIILLKKDAFSMYDILKEIAREKGNISYNEYHNRIWHIGEVMKILEAEKKIKFIKTVEGRAPQPKKLYRVV